MSHYICCPKCGEDSLDADTHRCDECGYGKDSLPGFPWCDLEVVIDYNWEAEEEDYERHVAENGTGEGHVYEHLKRLRDWLESHKPKRKE